MAVIVRCPGCQRQYQVDDGRLGASARCKKCGQMFTLAIRADDTVRHEAGPTSPATGNAAAPATDSKAGRDKAVSPPAAKSAARDSKLKSADRDAAGSAPLKASQDASSGEQKARKKIGPYAIRSRLGAGAMGEVWLGYDADLERDVAIKILPSIVGQDDLLKRFLREARLAAKLHNTNTVTVYQVGVDGELVYIAMELVSGSSLDRVIAADGPLTWRQATRVARDAAAGLAAAHDLGLVHRDIKPANLMRTTKGVTKVVDFGLARAQIASTQLTQDRMILGTPAFMAPEQWIGGEVDGRADLYALVCTYYFLMTGKTPFDAPSIAALGYQHRHEPFPDPRQEIANLPDAVLRILARGSQKKPADRYQTAEQLIADLDAVLAAGERPPAAVPWSQLTRLQSSPDSSHATLLESASPQDGGALSKRRTRLFVGAGAGVCAIAIAALSAMFFLRGSATPPLASTSPPVKSPLQTPPAATATQSPAQPPDNTSTQPPLANQPPAAPPVSAQVPPAAAVPVLSNQDIVVSDPPSVAAQAAQENSPATFVPLSAVPVSGDARDFGEVAPRWQQADAATKAAIQQARAAMFTNFPAQPQDLARILDSFTQSAVALGQAGGNRMYGPGARMPMQRGPSRLRGMPQMMQPAAPPATVDLALPERFLLSGNLGAVRVHGGSTWIYLWVAPQHGAGPMYPGGMMPIVPPVVGVEFPGVDLAQALVDYRAGDVVRVVVRRDDAKNFSVNAQNLAQAGIVDGHWPVLLKHLREFRLFKTPVGGAVMYWTLQGEGMEKAQQPGSWVDGKLGRAAVLTNSVDFNHSIGNLLRQSSPAVGARGTFVGQFQSVRVAKDTNNVTVRLVVPDTIEGSVAVDADLGPQVSARDLLGFRRGDPVEAAIEIVTPAGSPGEPPLGGVMAAVMAAQFPPTMASPMSPLGLLSQFGAVPAIAPQGAALDPLTGTPSVVARCASVQKQNDPASLVAPGVAPATADIEITPETAVTNPAGVIGLEVTWTGTLKEVLEMHSEARLSVQGDGFKAFEAFTLSPDFVDQLVDYISAKEDSSGGDTVVVSGKIVDSARTKERLVSGSAPLVELSEIKRPGFAGSIARPDHARAADSFDDRRLVTGLAALWRKPPAVGTELSFVARFRHFNKGGKQLSVTSEAGDSRTVNIKLRDVDPDLFTDMKNDDRLEIDAVVVKSELRGNSPNIEFEGHSVRRADESEQTGSADDDTPKQSGTKRGKGKK